MPSEFTHLTCYPIYPKSVYLSWGLKADFVDPGTYSYTVYRSGSPEGPWEKLNSIPLPNDPSYLDSEPNLSSKYRDIYYFVEAISGRGTTYTSPVKNLLRNVERREYIKATEINRQEMVLLRQYAGTEVHIFKKKHYGEVCSCYDPVTESIMISDCETCAGTRYVGGYWNPIRTFAAITPESMAVNENSELKTEIVRTEAWITAYPKVTDGDLLVEVSTNRRWVIKRVQNTELRRFPVKQSMVIHELSRDNPEYSIALDYCLSSLERLAEIPDHNRPKPSGTLNSLVDTRTPHLRNED